MSTGFDFFGRSALLPVEQVTQLSQFGFLRAPGVLSG
jgi:hypothetical protein